jgi:hypothetical protein
MGTPSNAASLGNVVSDMFGAMGLGPSTGTNITPQQAAALGLYGALNTGAAQGTPFASQSLDALNAMNTQSQNVVNAMNMPVGGYQSPSSALTSVAGSAQPLGSPGLGTLGVGFQQGGAIDLHRGADGTYSVDHDGQLNHLYAERDRLLQRSSNPFRRGYQAGGAPPSLLMAPLSPYSMQAIEPFQGETLNPNIGLPGAQSQQLIANVTQGTPATPGGAKSLVPGMNYTMGQPRANPTQQWAAQANQSVSQLPQQQSGTPSGGKPGGGKQQQLTNWNQNDPNVAGGPDTETPAQADAAAAAASSSDQIPPPAPPDILGWRGGRRNPFQEGGTAPPALNIPPDVQGPVVDPTGMGNEPRRVEPPVYVPQTPPVQPPPNPTHPVGEPSTYEGFKVEHEPPVMGSERNIPDVDPNIPGSMPGFSGSFTSPPTPPPVGGLTYPPGATQALSGVAPPTPQPRPYFTPTAPPSSGAAPAPSVAAPAAPHEIPQITVTPQHPAAPAPATPTPPTSAPSSASNPFNWGRFRQGMEAGQQYANQAVRAGEAGQRQLAQTPSQAARFNELVNNLQRGAGTTKRQAQILKELEGIRHAVGAEGGSRGGRHYQSGGDTYYDPGGSYSPGMGPPMTMPNMPPPQMPTMQAPMSANPFNAAGAQGLPGAQSGAAAGPAPIPNPVTGGYMQAPQGVSGADVATPQLTGMGISSPGPMQAPLTQDIMNRASYGFTQSQYGNQPGGGPVGFGGGSPTQIPTQQVPGVGAPGGFPPVTPLGGGAPAAAPSQPAAPVAGPTPQPAQPAQQPIPARTPYPPGPTPVRTQPVGPEAMPTHSLGGPNVDPNRVSIQQQHLGTWPSDFSGSIADLDALRSHYPQMFTAPTDAANGAYRVSRVNWGGIRTLAPDLFHGTQQAGGPGTEIAQGTAAASSPYLANQRARFAQELRQNPQTRLELAAVAASEYEQYPTEVVESLLNRLAYNGGTVHQGIHSGFYQPVNKGRLPGMINQLQSNPRRLAAMNAGIDRALQGSNLIHGYTDQGGPGDPNYGVGPTQYVGRAREGFNDWAGGRGGQGAARAFRENQQRQVAMEGRGTTQTAQRPPANVPNQPRVQMVRTRPATQQSTQSTQQSVARVASAIHPPAGVTAADFNPNMTVAEAARKANYKGSLVNPLTGYDYSGTKLSDLPDWVRKQFGLKFAKGGRAA